MKPQHSPSQEDLVWSGYSQMRRLYFNSVNNYYPYSLVSLVIAVVVIVSPALCLKTKGHLAYLLKVFLLSAKIF